MILNKQKKQTDPDQEVKKVILQLFNSRKFDEAKKEISTQITKYPNSSILFNILGAVLAEQEQLNEAVENYKKAITLNPKYAQAYNNMGVALQKLKKINDALDCYKKALSLKEDFAEVYNNMGNAMRDLGRPKEALPYIEKAIKINPSFPEAYLNIGAAYEETGNLKDAVKNYKKTMEIKPDFAEAYNSLALVLVTLTNFDEAILMFKKAIDLKPNYEKPYNNLGNLQNDLGKFDLAEDLYRQAIKIKPYYPKAQSNLLFSLNYKVDFDINTYLSAAKKLGSSWNLNKKKISIKYKYEKKPQKLKLGLVSSDFGSHPGGFFTLSTLRELKKRNFELIAYTNFFRKDDYVSNFKPLFSKWHSIVKKDDEQVIKQILEDGIHILIDMQGHSAHNRLPLFVYKSAPIQASWLAQGSTGIAEIDYFIGSECITPKKEEKNFVEKVLRLPEISQVFTPPDFDLKINDLPALKNNFITFGCLNKLTKVNDEVIKLWAKILSLIPNSKLLLKSWEFSNMNFCKETLIRFNKFNINENRLTLIGKSETRKEQLEIYNKVDISLDPFPFQGNTSTCESVWMGVPVLTLKGDRYLSHFGESINSNLNMSDWIANSYEEYVIKAKEFSSDHNYLAKIRKHLREKALRSPVFDAKRFSDHFSELLWKIWKDYDGKN